MFGYHSTFGKILNGFFVNLIVQQKFQAEILKITEVSKIPVFPPQNPQNCTSIFSPLCGANFTINTHTYCVELIIESKKLKLNQN